MHTPRAISDTPAPFISSATIANSARPGAARWLRTLLRALGGRQRRQCGTCTWLSGMDDALLRDIGQAPSPCSRRSNLDREISAFQL